MPALTPIATIAPTHIEVCVDCLHYLAGNGVYDDNGDTRTAAHGDAIEALWGDAYGIVIGNDFHGFSWASCDGCGSRLGGDRFAAVALARAFHA
jgi:hypothetical protein